MKRQRQQLRKTTTVLFTTTLIVFTGITNAQNFGINVTGGAPDNSAMLDIDAAGMNPKKGLLIPRMTTAERNAIPSPAQSLLIYNTTTKCFEFYDNSSWQTLDCVCTPPSAPTANAASGITATAFTANWSSVTDTTMYYLDVATDNGFTNFVPGFNNLNVGTVTFYNVSGLVSGATYYYRVRAGNSCSNSGNSNVISVTTSAFPPGQCGTQVWMTANMDVGTMINGNANQNNDSQVEKYCPNNVPANCTTYGGLYQWAEVVQLPHANNTTAFNTQPWMTCDPCGNGGRQGICPAGYHVPTDLEWSRYEWCVEANISPTGTTSLSTFQNNTNARGTNNNTIGPSAKLKANGNNSPAWDGTNASGFTALPAGWRENGGAFNNFASSTTPIAFFYSATEFNSSRAFFRNTEASSSGWRTSRAAPIKLRGYSLRCLQN